MLSDYATKLMWEEAKRAIWRRLKGMKPLEKETHKGLLCSAERIATVESREFDEAALFGIYVVRLPKEE